MCHVEAAAALTPDRRGGALDTEDLVPPLLLTAFFCARHMVNSLLLGTQQPVFHQPLPWATQIGPWKLGRGRKSSVVPPDGVARGKHSDPVVPENEGGNKAATSETFLFMVRRTQEPAQVPVKALHTSHHLLLGGQHFMELLICD